MIQLLLTAYILAKYIQKPKFLNRKPFNCTLCLTYWSFLVYEICNYTGVYDLITIPFCFALIASIMEQANDKYLLRG